MPALDVDQLIRDCAVGVAPTTMAAIVKVESRGNPWAIGNNTTRSPVLPKPRNKNEAVAMAKTLLAKGHNLDLGLAQINSANLKWLKLSVEEVMDPCINLNAGATVLKGFYSKASAKYGHGTKALLHALSGYNTGSLYKGTPYVKRIFAAAKIEQPLSAYNWKPAPTGAYPSPTYQPVSYNAPILVFQQTQAPMVISNAGDPSIIVE